jgi:hypothetical protein
MQQIGSIYIGMESFHWSCENLKPIKSTPCKIKVSNLIKIDSSIPLIFFDIIVTTAVSLTDQ